MKNLWKLAAALAVIAGAAVVIVRYGDKLLAKLQSLRERRCCCRKDESCSCGEKLEEAAEEAAEAVQETVQEVAEEAQEVAEEVQETVEDAVEAAEQTITEEDFAD